MGGTAKRVFELGGGRQKHPPPSSRWLLGGGTQIILTFYLLHMAECLPLGKVFLSMAGLYQSGP
jgi:hypothetical protein